jgi:predicted membrane-bound dolichyl-phosphate-mannose-protein mannosyltransferase
VLVIYFIASDRPLWAAFAVSLSISIKFSAILLVPSVLGWTHY